MWLFKDTILIVGLLVMAVATILASLGYLLDARDIRTETIRWGLTWNDLIFIVLAAAFWAVTFRLFWRLRKASIVSRLQAAKALLRDTAAAGTALLETKPINGDAFNVWFAQAIATLGLVWGQYKAMAFRNMIGNFLNPDVNVVGDRLSKAVTAAARQLDALPDQITDNDLRPSFKP